MSISSKLLPAWVRERQALRQERIAALPFPQPPPWELLEGLVLLRRMWASTGSVVPFADALVAASSLIQSHASLLIDFAPDREVWLRLLRLRGASTAALERFGAPVDFYGASFWWDADPAVGARTALLDAWDAASRQLPPEASRRNLLKSHRVRFPDKWRR